MPQGVRAAYSSLHFPQPALIARDPARGDRIENIAYKGLSGNLHPEFHGKAWREFLAARGLRWVTDAVEESQSRDDKSKLAWNDYREVDLVLAVRLPSRNVLGRSDLHPRKPATKLYNAWRAGVPALLGPELAYRELRESPLELTMWRLRIAWKHKLRCNDCSMSAASIAA